MDIAVSTSPAHIFMLRKKNVWYSFCDGNWNDPNTWMSNALDKKLVTCPQIGDDVYINHTVDYSNTLLTTYQFNNTIGNLFVSGRLTCNGAALNQCLLIVTGNLYVTGTIDFSATVCPITLQLRGNVNQIANFDCGTLSTIQYNSAFDQYVSPVTYNVLQISNTGTKYLLADLTVTSTAGAALNIDGTLDLQGYNCYLTSTYLSGKLKKTSSTGVVNFNGTVTIANSTGAVSFTGFSPIINLSGNILMSLGDLRGGFNWGNGTINVLTTQKWQMNNSGNTVTSMGNPTVIIASGKTLSINAPSETGNNGGWLLNGTGSVNGVDGTSTLNINGAFFYGNSSTVMATGVFNYNFSGISKIGINTGLTMTLPFTSFYALQVDGTATLAGNTTVSGPLSVDGSLQLSTYNFTASAATTYGGSILKSGIGTVNFASLAAQSSTGSINFSSNPTVNLSGNVTGDVRSGFNFGSGTINVTANINLGIWTNGNVAPTVTWSLVIASGKTLTNIGISASLGGLTTSGTITGADATAIFDNRSVFTYNNTTAPMATGKLNCNQLANNTVIYAASGNQDITTPSDATPGYQNLILQGSGAKRLLGNVSVKAVYTLTGPATLNSNGFALTNP